MTEVSPGRAAYEAYVLSSDGRSLISGEKLPAWDGLRPEVREAWRAAADGALMFAGLPRFHPAPGDDPVGRLLALPLPENDSGASTVRGYLVALLRVAWEAGDSSRPWGNSGWQHDLYHAMTDAGLARIGYDEDGYATEPDTAPSYAEANALIAAAIGRLGQ
jgi:hypothetical protein